MKRKLNFSSRMAAAQMHALAAVRREIRSRDSSSTCKYLREFNNSFRRYQQVLSAQELGQRIASANVLLVGDYHALPASQMFAASLVERVAQRSRLVLGVETVLSRHQPHLESWWRREIDQEQLRERLCFDRQWGYPWQPFCELILSARDHGEGVYGLDCMPRDDLRSIRSRDRHAAEKIREMRERHPGAVIMVVFGESHMAPRHLPALVRNLLPEDRALTVLQNLDSFYWHAASTNAAGLCLGEDALCVFNATPLEKYESYRLCLERWNASSPEEQPDFAPAVYNLIFSLARTLGFRLDSPHGRTQPKFLSDLFPEVINLEGEGGPNGSGENACSYSAEKNAIFIREFSFSAAAREASRFLYYACSGNIGRRDTPDFLADQLAHFGARLLCPGMTDLAPTNRAGEDLYQNYLIGRISRSAIRRMFLGRASAAIGSGTARLHS